VLVLTKTRGVQPLCADCAAFCRAKGSRPTPTSFAPRWTKRVSLDPRSRRSAMPTTTRSRCNKRREPRPRTLSASVLRSVPSSWRARPGNAVRVQRADAVGSSVGTELTTKAITAIIIFDRVRENLKKQRKESLRDVLNRSINETLPRSVLTHATVLAATLALLIFAGEVIRPFSWIMAFGVFTGTFRSVHVAGAILLWIEHKWPRATAAESAGAGEPRTALGSPHRSESVHHSLTASPAIRSIPGHEAGL
jgi:Protein export membrane protein